MASQDIQNMIALIADAVAQRNAQISQSISGREAILKKVTIDLGTARSINNALKVSIPFKSVSVEAATDTVTNINLSLGDNSLSAMTDAKILQANDSFGFDSMISSAYLWWAAQPGKVLTLVFSTNGDFRPGSQISQISGGLSISDGSVLASNLLTGGVATIACPAGVATKILDTDTGRKVMNLYLDNPAWIGDASVAPNARGVLVPAGIVEIKASALLYLYPVSGTVNVYGNDYR